MTNKPFDPTKPMQTRAGREARITCTDRIDTGGYSITALIMGEDNIEHQYSFLSSGRYYRGEECDVDLINIPVVRKGWFNVYPQGKESVCFKTRVPYSTRATAERFAQSGRIDCIEIEVTEGQTSD